MEGMGLRPEYYDPLTDASDWEQVKQAMQAMRQKITADVAAAPTHDSFFPDKPQETAPARGWQTRLQAST
ncbi:MAG TPA: hypothetical protein VK629_19340 [Steroidobacteraceae bacterium]|nr:hypothetical protein [Steroidobacteraceae bacterium]